ncbi:CDP-alcohol phosphatidyltransferase [Hartmannibacter diazotrophicus]|uniref:CDP-alcohol phosphatidyltransferase n=1 Tax=Hartmannibacter diazotrophicus TaxID=1482074 RepID=A0A2C9DBE4_9HYPH|nr:CDP-alcohol phosphatidyltransferase family protein [Hartmannibacter diazotrophicus]SON57617.1 CDP-alcohol phosphatidyltransferase [Hartmannibacter diazotrophicus]
MKDPASTRRFAPILTSTGLSLLMTGGALAAVAVAFSACSGLGAMVVWGAMASYLLLSAVVLATVTQHHPFLTFGLANAVTNLRAAVAALLTGVLAAMMHAPGHGIEAPAPMLTGDPLVALVVAVAVALLFDGVDGRLARSRGISSVFGARFDMEVDAYTILCLCLLLVGIGKLGPWVLAIGLMRYLFVLAGWWMPWLMQPLPPSRRRQAVCVLQYVALLVALLPPVTPFAGAVVVAISLGSLIWSFAVDILDLAGRRTAAA